MSKHPWGQQAGALVVIVTGTLLAGCGVVPPLSKERRVEFAEDAAAIYVSAYPSIPWTSISERMEPKFNLSAADARKMAAVTTQSQVDQFLSTFSASLGISLPLRTRSSLSTTANDTTTSSSTRTLAAPGIPSTGSSTTISDAALAADLAKLPGASGLDAATELQVGTGVYQLAQILDNQITKSITPKGYDAHLVTFQVNLQPTGRNLPYDAYVNVTLMPGSWQKAVNLTKDYGKTPDGLPPVIVYPLVISDAMESAGVGKSIEVVRQAALQLSGIVSNVGIGAGFSGGTDRLTAILGSDRNSLVTVGRVSDHTLRIRLGAVNQGSTQLAIVPRTQNVSVVVFTKSNGTDESLHIDKLAVITETRLVDVETGVPLESRRSGKEPRQVLRDKVVASLNAYQFRVTKGCSANEYSPLDVLSAIDRGDYSAVTDCLEDLGGEGPVESVIWTGTGTATVAEVSKGISLTTQAILPQRGMSASAVAPSSAREARLRRAIARLMTLQADSRYSKLMVELSPYKDLKPVLPRGDQFAALNDDGKVATMTLRGGANLKSAEVKAEMSVKQLVGTNTRTFVVLPSDLQVGNGGKDVAMSFPSLTSVQLMSAVSTVSGTPTHHLVTLESWVGGRVTSTVSYTVSVTAAKDKDKDKEQVAASPVSLGADGIVANRNGHGSLQVKVGKWDVKKDGVLAIKVDGAELRKIEGGTLDTEKDMVGISPASLVRLDLGNLQPWVPVSIQTLANGKALGKPLNLVVDRAR